MLALQHLQRFWPNTRFCLIFFCTESGDRTTGRDCSGFKLDASQETIDPDNEAGQLSCTWSCKVDDNKPCYSAVTLGQVILFPTECVTTIPCNEFNVGKTYSLR